MEFIQPPEPTTATAIVTLLGKAGQTLTPGLQSRTVQFQDLLRLTHLLPALMIHTKQQYPYGQPLHVP